MIEARDDLLEPPMNATERMYAAVAGEVPDRVPVYPKIWFDVAAKYTDTPFLQVIEDPFTALRVMMEAGLAVGADADITVIDPNITWTVDVTSFESQSQNSPFNGEQLSGRARQVFIGGELRYELS